MRKHLALHGRHLPSLLPFLTSHITHSSFTSIIPSPGFVYLLQRIPKAKTQSMETKGCQIISIFFRILWHPLTVRIFLAFSSVHLRIEGRQANILAKGSLAQEVNSIPSSQSNGSPFSSHLFFFLRHFYARSAL